MKLVDLKLSKADKKASEPTAIVGGKYEGPDYPYGLTLRLDNASLDKLGIDELPKVGAAMKVMAMAVVTSVSSHESRNREDRTVELQVQQLAMEDEDDDSLESIVKRRK